MGVVLLCVIAFYMCFAFGNGESQGTTISVDQSAQSGISSIQAAIDSVPSNNQNWITISVKAGVYNEKVKIPQDKPFIYLKGEGIGNTNIVSDPNESILTPTFDSLADNIVISGITFVNSYNYPPSENKNPFKPAVAAKISGDKSAFYGCRFLGYQDTLFDAMGRHYFKDCIIEGAVDFIFGNGQSIYEKCSISFNRGLVNPGSKGCIAAQGREHPEEGGGFVFKHCNVSGVGITLLGRAWKAYSRVIYYDSFLSEIIVPEGWDSWHFPGHEDIIFFAEEQCLGPGSDKSNRVKWERTLSPEELQSFTSISYIDSEGWISNLPIQ